MLKPTVVFNLCAIFIFSFTQSGYCSSSRQQYGGKVLNIAPNECRSSKYPGIVGTCMISLECQQRNGTVIGACRDGVLFGACCTDAQYIFTTMTSQESPLPPPPPIDENAVPFKIPQDLLNLAVFNIATNKPAASEELVTNSPEVQTPATESLLSNVVESQSGVSLEPYFSKESLNVYVSRERTSSQQNKNTNHVNSNAAIVEDVQSVNIANHSVETTISTATEKIEIVSQSTSFSTEKLTTPEITSPSPTTKFHYGKLKYSPRPVKFRSTTEKTLWIRPPTTETSYSVFTSSDEDEEDEEGDREISKLRVPEPVSIPSSSSVETSTVTVSISANSTEELTSTVNINETPTVPTEPLVSEPIELPTTTEKSTKLVNVTDAKLLFNLTRIAKPKRPLPQKQSRLSNEIEGEEQEDNYGNSDGWDTKLNEFVNQVVEGIAEELDKSNIDDVVFKPKPVVTKRTTTPKTTTKKPKASKKPKPKSSTTSVNKKKKNKNKTTTTTTKSPVVTKKPKPIKKVTTPTASSTSAESVETEHDVLDYREVCGVRPLVRKSRIVGGNPSTHGNWPWHALIKETVWWGMFSKVKCGGVLIGPKHVLTAAHCQPQQTGTLFVVLGVTDSDNPSVHAVTKGVRRVIRHPEFNPRSYENDIAILELESEVPFQKHIVPICLPGPKENFVGKKGYVTGMGLLKHDGERPSMLYEVDVPILNNTDCQKMFRKSGNMKPIKPSFICAGYRHGRKDSCGGDSGGPLSVRRTNGQWVLAGTVSHGIKCAVPNQPGVYMRTTWYRPWIDKVVRMARSDLPKCHGPPSICNNHQARSGGLMNTIYRIFRIARRLWKLRK